MHSITMFDSTKESLQDLLRSIREGKTQLPDFQRGWVWDDFHIRSLLASVSMSYPIGAVMMLQTGNPDVRFKPRPVEGVVLAQPREPDRLILDAEPGQPAVGIAADDHEEDQQADAHDDLGDDDGSGQVGPEELT